ncbi:hypothetical protein B0H16DRAFT_1728840 [Mycena metata]|uniref:Uncharacterized protein n=1 Tax=Mycena metata TaxID=1033252 RepID=A0AAD7IDT6_9AGAR|nr:hypothetical protein B0H16DRAFT_1728840 [Mycena metata]
MPPPAPPPGLPSYEDAVEEAEILAVLTDLNDFHLTPVDPPQLPRTPNRPLPSSVTPSPRARYSYHTPTTSALTSSWAEAATATQGVSGASPLRLEPKRKSRKKKRGYAVFSGWRIGAFPEWNAEVIGLVSGVPNSLYQGYETLLQAQAAFEYAQVRGWTRVISPDGSPSASIARPPSPVGFSDPVNALHATRSSLWYVVYAGITPGVYASSLECSLNTLGLRSPAFESCESKEVVIRLFQEALAAGNIRKIYPSYT